MQTYLRLAASALLPVLVSAALYIAIKKTAFGRAKYAVRQAAIGVVFGAVACFGTEYGIAVGGATVNVRDAAPLCAGLIFGGPAGIIAGLIGGAERWFAALWGAGEFSRAACTISTIFAGLYAAALRRYMFDGKKPTWGMGLACGIVMEVLHLTALFLTNLSDARNAFIIVQACTAPMILLNAVSVALAIVAVSLLSKERLRLKKESVRIAQKVQLRLLACVVVAFFATTYFTYVLQTGLMERDATGLLKLNIDDVRADITDASNANLLALTRTVAGNVQSAAGADEAALSALCERYGIAEINLVDESGVITASSNDSFVGYDMASGGQSAEFLALLGGAGEYVQSYQPISYDKAISRKYAGVALAGGGFVQVGYDAEQFQSDIDSKVVGATRNRHVGENGCVIIADLERDIVSDPGGGEGDKLLSTGISIDPAAMPPGERFEAELRGERSFCMYAISEGYYIIAALPRSEAVFARDIAVYVNSFMEVIVFAALFALIYFLIKKLVVDNIRRVNATLAEITGGNLNVTVDVRSSEEFASLSDDINSTVTTLKRYIAEAAARIDKELEFAREIQRSALPGVFPPYPNRRDIDIFARMDAAKEVGGDFYDFYLIDEDSLAILVADVSGKGIPAAMFMMRAKSMLKSLAESGMSLSEIFTRANQNLCAGNDASMFVTAWMGIVDLKTGAVDFANAGHNPPLVRRAGGSFEYLKSKAGFVLAGLEDYEYRAQRLELEPGDTIYLYTDGVTEATDADNRLYGEDRLKQALERARFSDMRSLCAAVKNDVDAFAGGEPQFDDMTMLALKLTKGDEPVGEITVDARVENLERVTDFVNSRLDELGCAVRARDQIDVAIDELFSNVSRYAYRPGVGPVTVRVEVSGEPLCVIVTFIDGGVPFDPLKSADPDTALSAGERELGGLGIFMVKKMMDEISYEYKDGRNILRIRKNI